ncbi:MAG: 50S ribosomal protein L4 [Candidatus Paceibacterota bacterium]
MANAKTYNSKGKESGEITLPEKVFGVKWNANLVHQVITSLMSSKRKGTAHAKTRGEVRGGGKKPWKQKGTGRARHGSTRSPIWVGGGVAHGPRNDKNYERKVNVKQNAKALASILSAKLRDGEIIFVDEIDFKAAKTQDAVNVIKSLSKIKGFERLSKRTNAALIALSGKNEAVEKSFQNIGSVSVLETRNINPVEALKYKYILIENPTKSVKVLEDRMSK